VTHIDEQESGLALKVNGTVVAVGRRPDLESWRPALRGVALSDSPVLVQAPHHDASFILDRLHRLGRRSDLPVHHCHDENDGPALLECLDRNETPDAGALGTWAIFNVHWWSDENQLRLADLLGRLDEARLHGRLRHDQIPRVIVTMNPETPASGLRNALRQRLCYYQLSAVTPKKRESTNATA
jgi:hypothetical protein